MTHIRTTPLRCWLLFATYVLSSSLWSQGWQPKQERDLRWNAQETMMGSRTSYSRLCKMQAEKREAFKDLFTSPDAEHVLDIPGTPGLLFDGPVTAKDYVDVAMALLEEESLNIEIDLLWISPSEEISDTRRRISLTLRKKTKWYPIQIDTPLEWVVTLKAQLEAEINENGEVQEMKIASVQLESRPQAHVRVLTKIKCKPIPFRSQSSELPLTLDGSPLVTNKDNMAIVLVPDSGIALRIDEGSDLVLSGKDKSLTLPKAEQSRFLNDPSVLDISQTISGFKYYGRLTAGLTAVQMIGHGMYQSAPVDIMRSSWSPGLRLSFLAPVNEKWDWTALLGLQTRELEANFEATQFRQLATDADAMEYERLTDVTLGRESLASNTFYAGLGAAYKAGSLFIKGTGSRSLTSSHFEAEANVQQRGHYPSLYGITIDDAGIYDFGAYTTSTAAAYERMSGWMVEGAVGYQLPYGSTKWPPSTRPMCYLSAGFRHHAMTMASNGEWVKETQSLQGALDAFGGNSFQTYFLEIAFDLRKRTPPTNN